ncbi:hypothetical protein AS149_25815 [Burkholderia cenocepacia]|nr:hypothetical protein AS149_25815 [Burkholderia cenocepacia]
MTRRRGCIEVLYTAPGNPYGYKVSVAAMTLFEGTGCWMVTDWRLSKYKPLSPWSSSLNADDVCAQYRPKSKEELIFVTSLLREYEEKDGELLWCTFDNFYRGHPDVGGVRPSYRTHHQAGYFGYREAFAKLREIKGFWDAFEGDPLTARIGNPDRQPSASEVSMETTVARLTGALPEHCAH